MPTEQEILWSKLPDKELDCIERIKRVLFFDPSSLPNLFTPKPFKRTQSVWMYDLFPEVEGTPKIIGLLG